MSQVRTGDLVLVKALNKGIVLNMLRGQGPISRADIAKATGLNKATVSALVDELSAEHMVTELGPGESSGGRRPQLLMLNEQAGLVAGVELGIGYLLVMLLDLRAGVRWRRRVAFPLTWGWQTVLERVAGLIAEGLGSLPPTPLGLLGAGVGLPGLVDHRQGRLIYAPHLDWQDLPVREWLEKRLGVSTLVDNEANAGAIGELWAGAAGAASNFIYLSGGVGLGAGVVLGRELYRGAGGVAGELGHTTIDVAGPVCSCGNQGCWEVFASEIGLRHQVERLITAGEASVLAIDDVSLETAAAAARQGDAVAEGALAKVGEYLGVGIASTLNAFNPELVVIGSSMAAAGEYILVPAQRAVEARSLRYPRSQASVVLSTLGTDGCAVGAGALVLQQYFRLPALIG